MDIENKSGLGGMVNEILCLAGLLTFLLHSAVPDTCAFAQIAVMLDVCNTTNLLQ